jgi:hypothetical protein
MSSGLVSEAPGTRQGTPQIPDAWIGQIVSYLETLISSYQISVMLARLALVKIRRPTSERNPDQYALKRRLYRLATRLLVVELHERVRVHDAGIPLARPAIEHMPAPLRTAFLLYVEQGCTFRQIARELHIRPDTAKVRISLARSWLLERYFIPDPEFLM